MQREIKFRAWDKRKKIMRDVECIGSVFNKSGVYDTANGREWVMNDFIELMQFTGLKDKNGKEIYEGDILWDGCKENMMLVIGWNSHRCCYSMYSDGECKCFIDDINLLNDCVIGNIYENPELLKMEDNQ